MLLLSGAICLAAWIEAAMTTAARAEFLDNLQWSISAWAAAWVTWQAARLPGLPAELRKTRSFFAHGALLLGLGQVLYDVESWRHWLPFPAPSDFLFILAAPAFVGGFLDTLREGLSAGRRRVVVLDVCGFALAILTLALAIYLPFASRASPFELAFLVAYPVVMLSAAASALVTHLYLRQRWTLSWQMIFFGLCVEGLIWMTWNRAVLNQEFLAGSWLSGFFSIAVLMIGCGAAAWRPQTNTSADYDRLCEGLLRQIPLLTVALTATSFCIVVLDKQLTQTLRITLVGLGLTAVFVAIVRQTQQLGERDRLIEAEKVVAESQAKLHYLAHHDPLTGLPNRTLLRERVEQALVSADSKGLATGLIFIDLDQFKEVNDTLGHATGDALLCHIARQLEANLHWTDTVSRQGGDEFTIVLPDLKDVDDAARVAERLMEICSETARANGYELPISMSVGIALHPDDGRDFDTLLQCADAAMYRAKAEGRNTYRFYDAQMHARATDRLHMRMCLSHAIERGELRLHYQPQIDLQTGAFSGAEALLRWESPELGSVPPSTFIPIAEESGLIVEIGGWVLREVCRQAAAWHAIGIPATPVAVNVSVLQFRRGNLEQQVQEALQASYLPAHLLELELTESVLLQDHDRVIATINSLGTLGVRFAIDDFGTGYSSLGYLRQLRVSKLKIDRSFVRETLGCDADGAGIVKAMINLAHTLRLQTVAEGVETAEQADLLRAAGCNIAQGYYYSRPLDPIAFEHYVSAVPPLSAAPTLPTHPSRARARARNCATDPALP
ncbi:MAG TPA: EAL domain-containing protein [Steroidobacteraceae bacterium]|nr:EAL domain-containing protein [Steroidobacteraceae bacterium]